MVISSSSIVLHGLDMFGYVWICLDMLGYVWICLDMFGFWINKHSKHSARVFKLAFC